MYESYVNCQVGKLLLCTITTKSKCFTTRYIHLFFSWSKGAHLKPLYSCLIQWQVKVLLTMARGKEGRKMDTGHPFAVPLGAGDISEDVNTSKETCILKKSTLAVKSQTNKMFFFLFKSIDFHPMTFIHKYVHLFWLLLLFITVLCIHRLKTSTPYKQTKILRIAVLDYLHLQVFQKRKICLQSETNFFCIFASNLLLSSMDLSIPCLWQRGTG